MDKNIVNSGSITYAIRGRDALRNNGCKAYMFRNKGKSAVGCGYSISTNCSKADIEKIFMLEKIKYVSIVSGEEV